MQHITGISRNQMTIASLESSIASDNPIRFIDAFVENIVLKALGFEVQTLKTEGRPSFETKLFSSFICTAISTDFVVHVSLKNTGFRNLKLQFSFVDEMCARIFQIRYHFQKKHITTN